MLASTLYEPGLNSSASRSEPNWLSFCALNTESSFAWMLVVDMPGSKMATLGPKSGVSEVGSVPPPPSPPVVVP